MYSKGSIGTVLHVTSRCGTCRAGDTAQRGDEWYVFCEKTGLIREIRAYYAAPAVQDTAQLPRVGEQFMGELVDFDYAGRGYHLRWD